MSPLDTTSSPPLRFDADYAMTIAGQAVIGDAQLEVINPATGKAFATAPRATAKDLDAVVQAARAAFKD